MQFPGMLLKRFIINFILDVLPDLVKQFPSDPSPGFNQEQSCLASKISKVKLNTLPLTFEGSYTIYETAKTISWPKHVYFIKQDKEGRRKRSGLECGRHNSWLLLSTFSQMQLSFSVWAVSDGSTINSRYSLCLRHLADVWLTGCWDSWIIGLDQRSKEQRVWCSFPMAFAFCCLFLNGTVFYSVWAGICCHCNIVPVPCQKRLH